MAADGAKRPYSSGLMTLILMLLVRSNYTGGATYQLTCFCISYVRSVMLADCKHRDKNKNKLQSIVSKAIRYGFLPLHFQTLADLVSDAEQALFFSITHNPIHVLHHLLPPIKHTSYNLRARTHSFSLPVSQSNQLRRNFLYHMLYKDIY